MVVFVELVAKAGPGVCRACLLQSLDLEVHVMTNQSREDDDQATGLPDLPKLIFLDTNIVQNLHSFGEFIFDRVSTPDLEKKLSTLGPRVTADIYALADFMALN